MSFPLLRVGLSCWDETKILPGQYRQEVIAEALGTSSVAVLLVSPAFLAAESMLDQALPAMLAAAYQSQRLKVLWVPVRPCLWMYSAVACYEAVHDPARPLSTLVEADIDLALVTICQRISMAVSRQSVSTAAALMPPSSIDLAQFFESIQNFSIDMEKRERRRRRPLWLTTSVFPILFIVAIIAELAAIKYKNLQIQRLATETQLANKTKEEIEEKAYTDRARIYQTIIAEQQKEIEVLRGKTSK